MRILLRRWTTQFFDLEGVLEEDEPEPEVLEEVEDLGGDKKKKERVGSDFPRIPAASCKFSSSFTKRQPVVLSHGSVL